MYKTDKGKTRSKWCKYNGNHKKAAPPKAGHRSKGAKSKIAGHHRKSM